MSTMQELMIHNIRLRVQSESPGSHRWEPVRRFLYNYSKGHLTEMYDRRYLLRNYNTIDVFSEGYLTLMRGMDDEMLLDLYALVIRQYSKQM